MAQTNKSQLSYEILANGYVVSSQEGFVAGRSITKSGAIAIAFPSTQSGTEWIRSEQEDLDSMYPGAYLEPVAGNPWELMRKTAAHGLTGIVLIDEGGSSLTHFVFMTRIEDTGNELPTVLSLLGDHGIVCSFTRTGERQLDHSQLVHWDRYDLTDPVTSKWGNANPFRGWNYGEPIYELQDPYWMMRISDHALLGPWIGIAGGLPLFTSEALAVHYLDAHAGVENNRFDFIGDDADFTDGQTEFDPKIQPIYDLHARCQELAECNPLASICINPDGHREDMAYISGNNLISVSGTWEILPGNQLNKLEGYTGKRGRDTIGWSGGQELQLMPLAKSFTDDRMRKSDGALTDLTRVEAEEYVQNFFDNFVIDDTMNLEGLATDIRDSDWNDLDNYYMSCWDSVTGARIGSPNGHLSFLHILGWLSRYEALRDRPYRVTGASKCRGEIIGFGGSGDEGHEGTTGSHFQVGLLGLGVASLVHGYTPSYSNRLVSICNQNLKTLHVEFAGYAKDLLWAVNESEFDQVITSLQLSECSYNEWIDSADAHIDSVGERLAIEAMGEHSWNRLSSNSQHFISTALATLEELGHIPQRDYATISLEIVKSLEVELVRILGAFKEQLPANGFEYDVEKFEESSLISYIDGGRPPTLGTIGFLLQPPRPPVSPLRKELAEFLLVLPNNNFITANRFTRRVLQRVINKYRNGGVHENPIRYEVCVECITELIGTPGKRGIISQVLDWQSP